MSIPSNTIYCDACDYTASSLFGAGLRRYQLPDGREINLPRGSGWCYECKALRSVEKLPPVQEVSARADELRREIRSLRGKLRKVWRSVRNRISKPGFQRATPEQQLAETEILLDILQSRTNPRRCLECGSEKVEVVLLDYGDGETSPICLKAQHPGCGGMLWYSEGEGGFGYAFSRSPKLYSSEGEFLGWGEPD